MQWPITSSTVVGDVGADLSDATDYRARHRTAVAMCIVPLFDKCTVTTTGMVCVVIDRHDIAYCAMASAHVYCGSDVHRCDAVSVGI